MIGKPNPGETVVVAAASGLVGSLAGQLAKLAGARAVGIAGGPEKCAYVKDELGFDAAVDHKSADFAAQLATACPNGAVHSAGFDDGAIAEVVAQVVLNIFTNYFNQVAGTEIDFPMAPLL